MDNEMIATISLQEFLSLQAKVSRLEAENVKLRKIASYVPADIYLSAKESAGYGEIVKGKLHG